MSRPRDDHELTHRLRSLIIADVVLTAVGSAFTITMYFVTASTAWLFWIGLYVGALSGTMAIGLVPLRRGNRAAALLWLCGSNWAAAVVVTSVATFSWPLMLQAGLLPAAIAIAFVPREQFAWYGVASVAVAATAAALGLLQDFSGLSDEVPRWSRTSVLLVFTPLISGFVVFVALQNGFRLQSALGDAWHAQDALADQADELRRSRARVVAATDRERRRIERDLHDGAQSRLVAINLRLANARSRLRDDPDGAERTLELLRHELHEAQSELRDLAHGVYPTALTQHGLVPAVQAAADHSPIPITLELRDVGRHPIDVESACYFCILEALQNSTKHAAAETVRVSLARNGRWLRFEIADDGVGFDVDTTDGVGLQNLRDRLGAIGGELSITSGTDSGTIVAGRIPVG